MNREIETGIGAVAVPASLGLLFGLPPPVWPDMPPYLVHGGLLLGLLVLVIGLSLLSIGFCRYTAEHRICKKLISQWERMWTPKRIAAAIVCAIALVTLAPLALPTARIQVAFAQPTYKGDCNGPNYGTNNCDNTYNLAPPDRHVDESAGAQILRDIPKDKPILGPVDKPRPDADASWQDESQEAGGEVVISGGDATVLLEMPNEALNP
jgi:hypothetical protein